MQRRILKPVKVFSDLEETGSNLNSLPSSSVEEADVLKAEGSECAANSDFKGALNKWYRGLQLNPNDYEMLEMKAQVYMQLGFYVEAAKSVETAVSLRPQWAPGHHTLARCRREMGEVDLAKESYIIAKSLDSNNEEIVSEYAEIDEISLKLHELRQQRLETLNNGISCVEKEAELCMYNLSSRVSVTDSNI